MAKIKIAEIFHSLQGEGLWVGVPSVFVRTFSLQNSTKRIQVGSTPHYHLQRQAVIVTQAGTKDLKS